MEGNRIKTRFAPSPTGYLHIGGARTALFNWLYARHTGGNFVLRIEDTDQQRSTEASTRAILDAMTWLGLDWDEGPYYQAERVDFHRQKIRDLIREGKAYYCTCSQEVLEEKRKKALAAGRKPKYDGTCREKGLKEAEGSVVRFKTLHMGVTVVDDLIKGTVRFENEELDDLVIQRGDRYPTYNFAVVVDDAEMGITHVIRGDDHLNNTPRQILIYEALGYAVPEFAHVPMILGSDRTRLSKRHGATSVMAYYDMGYLPEALVNYLVRLGWSYGDQEIFSAEEMIRFFTLDSVGKSAAVFNPEKLLWLNQHYLREADTDRVAAKAKPFFEKMGVDTKDGEFLKRVVGDLKPRSKTLVDLAENGTFYFQDSVSYDDGAVEKFLKADVVASLETLARSISSCGDYTKTGIEALLRKIADDLQVKLKVIAQPLRVALTGKTVSPGLDEVMVTLGKDRVVNRIDEALRFIRRGGKN